MDNIQPYAFMSSDEVHIWLLPINEFPAEYYSEYSQFLSVEERLRNQRYIFENDRIRHLLTRIFIRKLLSGYLSIDPGELVFETNSYDRPSVKWTDGDSGLDFNLSHAGNLIACGIVQNGRIGIDVEPIDREVNIAQASRFFSKMELEELFQLPPQKQKEHFLRLWTLKEAYIKSRGMGMSIPLHSFGFQDFSQGHMRFWEQSPSLFDENWYFFSMQPLIGHRLAGARQQTIRMTGQPLICLRKFIPSQETVFEEVSFRIEHACSVGF